MKAIGSETFKRLATPWVRRREAEAKLSPSGRLTHPLTKIQFSRASDLESWLYLYAFNHQEVL